MSKLFWRQYENSDPALHFVEKMSSALARQSLVTIKSRMEVPIVNLQPDALHTLADQNVESDREHL